MGEQQTIYTRGRWKIGAVVLVAGLIYLIGNNRVALWDRDEPRYAMASRWMATHGDWVVPRIGWGEAPETPRTAKPVLVYWCQAACMKIFMPTTFAARLPSAVAMVLTLCVVAIAVRRFAGQRHAFWTTLILSSTVLTVTAAKLCITDSVLLLWITLAQICLFGIYRGGSNENAAEEISPYKTAAHAAIFWVAIGLGGLTKGPVALGIPATAMIVLALVDKRIAWWRKVRPVLGVIVVALIVAPWLVLVHMRAPGVMRQMIFHDVVERIQTGLEGHKEKPGFYLVTIFATFFPWSLLLPVAIGTAWKNRHRAEIRFALAAVIGPWIMMELVQTKLVHYLLPVFPPLAFLVADAAIQCFDGKYKDLTNTAAFVGGIVWGLILIALCSAPWLAARNYLDLPWQTMLAMSALGIVSAATVAILSHRKRPAAAFVTMAASFMALMAMLFGLYFPQANFLRLSPRIASVLKANQPDSLDVVMIGYREQSVPFYQGGTIREENDRFLISQPEASWPRYIVVTRAVFDSLPKQTQDRLQVLAEFEGMNYAKSVQKIRVLVARRLSPTTTNPTSTLGSN